MIGELLKNLDYVLDHLADRDVQLTALIKSFRKLVSGLKTDREAILGSIEDISRLSVETADLVKGIRPPFVEDIKQLRRFARNTDNNKAELDRALQVLPIKLNKVGRTAIDGSWFNFYLCYFRGKVRLPGLDQPIFLPNEGGYQNGADRCTWGRSPDMKPFRERNPVVIGAVSILVMALALLAAFRAQDLPLIGGGDTYYAKFTEAGGLQVNDEVRIAGVRVGKVEEIKLDGGEVRVKFRIQDDSPFGSDTGAAIKVKTLLGSMFLARRACREGPARGGGHHPDLAHQLAVRRRRGVHRPGRDHLRDRHRPARQLDDGARRPDPQHSGGVPRRAAGRLPALDQPRRPRPGDRPAAHQPAPHLDGARRA